MFAFVVRRLLSGLLIVILLTFLTYLVVEAYLQAHFGTLGGEFRLGVDIPRTATTPAVFVGAPTGDVGLAVRLSL